MKNCKRCLKEFEPKNPKGKFCSDRCRVYWNRVNKLKEAVKQEGKKWFKPKEVKVVDLNEQPKAIRSINTMPKGLSITDQLEWRANHTK